MPFECINPILRVGNMAAALRFYVGILGFENASWGTDDFTSINRDGQGIYLCRGGQGQGRAWVWIGVEDVEPLYEEYKARGVTIRMPATNFPWALEMQIEDRTATFSAWDQSPKPMARPPTDLDRLIVFPGFVGLCVEQGVHRGPAFQDSHRDSPWG